MNSSNYPLMIIHNQIENLINRSGNEIYDELFRLEQENTDNTPASQEFINNLTIKKITNEEDLTCSICHEKMYEGEDYIELECKHSFHKNCLKKWLEIDNTCPICRKILDKSIREEYRRTSINLIYLTIYFPNRSILYKSFYDNITFSELIDKLKNYLPDNLSEKLLWIKNTSNGHRNYFDNDSNLTLKDLNFNNGSKINFMF